MGKEAMKKQTREQILISNTESCLHTFLLLVKVYTNSSAHGECETHNTSDLHHMLIILLPFMKKEKDNQFHEAFFPKRVVNEKTRRRSRITGIGCFNP